MELGQRGSAGQAMYAVVAVVRLKGWKRCPQRPEEVSESTGKDSIKELIALLE